MARYLSPEWFAETGLVGNGEANALRVKEVVTGTPDGTVTWVLACSDKPRITLGDADADVTLSQDYETAAALYQGQLTVHDAFFQGRIRVTGSPARLGEATEALRTSAEALAATRATTTF